MEAKIRRTQDNLFVLGTGVIAFGLWNLLKFAIYFFAAYGEIKQAVGNEHVVLYIIVLWGLFLCSLSLWCFVGISARAEGKGKRKRIIYLVFAGIITLAYFCAIVLEIIYLIVYRQRIFLMVVSLVIDITSFVFLVEMIVNSIKIRKLRKVVSE